MTKDKVIPGSFDEKLAKLNKKYKSAVADTDRIYEVIPTGSFSLNKALGIGGIALGKLVEMYGPSGAGKSTLTLEIIAQAQLLGKSCALVDFEHCFDKKYAKAIGVNTEKLLVYQPDSQEEGYDLIIEGVEQGLLDLIVLDSHTAAAPQAIIEGEMGDHTMGLQARNNSKFLMKIKGILNRSNSTLIAISQYRQNIGAYGGGMTTTGGNGWKFYSDVRLKITRQIDKTGDLSKTEVVVEKNKLASPFTSAKFNVIWGQGIDRLGEVIDLAVEKELLSKRAAWFTLDDGTKIQGDEEMKKYMKSNPEFLKEIIKKVFTDE